MASFLGNRSRSGLILFVIAVITFLAFRSLFSIMLAKQTEPRVPSTDEVVTQLKKRKTRVVEPVDQERVLTRLHKARAVLYGASWCSFTVQQVREVGYTLDPGGATISRIASDEGAGATHVPKLRYVPCDIKAKACQSAGVKGFPSWKIRGKMYSGFQSVENLDAILA